MSMTTDAANRLSRSGLRPGWYIPYLFFAFFGVVIAVNGVMLYFATSTFNGLQTEDHFIKGIKYNQDLAGAKAQAERAWKVDLAFESPEPGKGRVTLNLHDKHGNLLKDAKVRIKFIRPTMQGYDRTITPEYAGDGRYVAGLDLPLPGIWDLRLVIEHASGDYQDQQRIFVK
ncbi:MAG TPA: FixH family protein [Azospirillum sp.]|nr:FixH family protein [Azospirillum sp.]